MHSERFAGLIVLKPAYRNQNFNTTNHYTLARYKTTRGVHRQH
jgi:hypothetical protein